MPAAAWEFEIDRGGARDIEVDGANDVLAAGTLVQSGTDSDLGVVKLDATTGAELWRVAIDGDEDMLDSARVLAVDGVGDVVVAGDLISSAFRAAVLKLDGASGAELWRRRFPSPVPPGLLFVYSLAITAGGDVFYGSGQSVRRLDGPTGADVWDQPACHGVSALDGAGNVVGSAHPGGGLDIVVCKLDGSTGAVLWTAAFGGGITMIAVDASGDVFVAGNESVPNLPDRPILRKLDGATGTEIWHVTLGSGFGGTSQVAVEVDPAGDVIVGAPGLVKLDGATGTQIWSVPGAAGQSLTIGPTGDIFSGAGSSFMQRRRGSDGGVLWQSSGGRLITLDGLGNVISSTGGWHILKHVPIAGRRLAVVETPTGTKLVLKVKDDALLVPYPIGNANEDLLPTQVGATLELSNQTSGETDVISLPAANWVSNEQYVDKTGNGPCRKAKLRKNVLKVSCKGIGFTLDEPLQGELVATFTIGTDPATRQCAVFGGDVKLDAPGIFKAKKAPPVLACP